jgi:hypothetical protein
MTNEWFLHDREDNSFYFRLKSSPDTDMEGFTITYVKPGYGILTGDMGCLTWQRNESGFDYGFPNEKTGIEYFAEKVCKAEQQETLTWTHDKAIEDIKKWLEEDKQERLESGWELPEYYKEIEELIENNNWQDHSEIGKFQMYEDLFDIESDNFWCEFSFGEDWDYHFKRKFEMIKSVSGLVLDAVRKEEVKE